MEYRFNAIKCFVLLRLLIGDDPGEPAAPQNSHQNPHIARESRLRTDLAGEVDDMCVVIVERSKNTARRVHVVYPQRLGQVALCQHTQRTDSILTIIITTITFLTF